MPFLLHIQGNHRRKVRCIAPSLRYSRRYREDCGPDPAELQRCFDKDAPVSLMGQSGEKLLFIRLIGRIDIDGILLWNMLKEASGKKQDLKWKPGNPGHF